MRSLLVVAISLGLTSLACGQRLWFGLVGGTNVTANFPRTDYTTPADSFGNPASRFQFLTGNRSLIIGLSAEAHLFESFSIEVDVLRRPMNSTIIYTRFPAGSQAVTSTLRFTEVEAWEFPVLLKYGLPSRWAGHPFLAIGPEFRSQQNAGATELTQTGISAGAGASFNMGRIRIGPQVRYTRWSEHSIYPKYATKPDQLEFLAAIAYRTESESRRLAGRKLELGIIAGLPVTRGFQTFDGDVSEPERPRYLAGLTAGINVSHNFRIETDAIYKPLRAGSNDSERFSVLTWQFPVVAKYMFAKHAFGWQPFAEGGPSFRLAGNLNGYNPSHYGVTAGAGVGTTLGGVLLAPALRYTKWTKDPPPLRLPAGVNYNYPRTNPNALELVLSASF
jgi:hypothetical protein